MRDGWSLYTASTKRGEVSNRSITEYPFSEQYIVTFDTRRYLSFACFDIASSLVRPAAWRVGTRFSGFRNST